MFITIKIYRKQGIVQRKKTNDSNVATMETASAKIDQMKSPTPPRETENPNLSVEVYENIGGSDQLEYMNFDPIKRTEETSQFKPRKCAYETIEV